MDKTKFNLTFGQALDALNAGKQVAQLGDKGFYFKTAGRIVPLDDFMKFKNGNSDAIETARALGIHTGEDVIIADHIDKVTDTGVIVCGVEFSKEHGKATNWGIVEAPEKKSLGDGQEVVPEAEVETDAPEKEADAGA